MFLRISLAHYQLPQIGVTTISIATEIGADQRSVLLRPIGGTGQPQSASWPTAIEAKPAEPSSQDHRDWLARVDGYKDAAAPNR